MAEVIIIPCVLPPVGEPDAIIIPCAFPEFGIVDTTAPEITAFVLPETSTSLTVTITTLTATDDTAVTGYYLSESDTTPEADAEGWVETAPTEYEFADVGEKTLYIWAKDAAGNISDVASDSVEVLYAITYYVNDDFTTDRAAGSVDGTAAEPGPGVRNVDSAWDGDLSIAGEKMNLDDSGSSWSTGFFLYQTLARAAGLASYTKVTCIDTGFVTFGLAAYNLNTNTEGTLNIDSNGYIGVQGISSGFSGARTMLTVSNGETLELFQVVKNAGYLVFAKIGGIINLLFSTNVSTDNVKYRINSISAGNTEYDFDAIYNAQLPAPFNTDFGLATDHHAGAVAEGTEFTHPADFWFEDVVTAMPTAGERVVSFRKQDANNYWRYTVATDGTLDLDEVVAGTPTQRGTSAIIVSAGHRICIIGNDESITVFSNDVRRFAYTSAANFKTATGGKVESLGTGGALSDLVTRPIHLTGTSAGIFDQLAEGK